MRVSCFLSFATWIKFNSNLRHTQPLSDSHKHILIYNHQAGYCREKSSPSPENYLILKSTPSSWSSRLREREGTNKQDLHSCKVIWGRLPCKHEVQNLGGICKVHGAVLWQLIKFLHYITTLGYITYTFSYRI